ncbi:hypothetical protein [Mycoplasmopsis columboralis]|uniref:hypothetical protein n=1 Tax=Mycoplasmopsis columboralis TaxID=171282 RepID=UPI0013EDEE1A|nr:hypothetical protein [Mycoplasmopsis columboralis]
MYLYFLNNCISGKTSELAELKEYVLKSISFEGSVESELIGIIQVSLQHNYHQ